MSPHLMDLLCSAGEIGFWEEVGNVFGCEEGGS